MSTVARRIACLPKAGLQVEERPRPIVRSNGNRQARPNGNGRGSTAANWHGNSARAANGANGNAARTAVKPRVIVAAQNRLLREALSRMLTKHGGIEVITSEAARPFQNPVQARSKTTQRARSPGQDWP